MTVRVLFFAYLKDVTGTPAFDLQLLEGARVTDALAAVVTRWPALDAQLVRIPVVLDGRVVEPDALLTDGAELAWLPPVGGGAAAADEPGVRLARLTEERALTYEAYDRVAAAQIAAVAREASARWPDARIALEHRTGRLVVGEASVAIAVACPHRAEAFACCRYLIDRVKEAVPIWKREEGPSPGGVARWLPGHAYRPTDDA